MTWGIGWRREGRFGLWVVLSWLSSVVHEGGKRAESWRERCREFCGGGMGVGWGKGEVFLNSFERGDLCEDIVVVTTNSVKEELHRRCKLGNRYRLIP